MPVLSLAVPGNIVHNNSNNMRMCMFMYRERRETGARQPLSPFFLSVIEGYSTTVTKKETAGESHNDNDADGVAESENKRREKTLKVTCFIDPKKN